MTEQKHGTIATTQKTKKTHHTHKDTLYTHTYIHSRTQTYMQACMHARIHTHTCMHHANITHACASASIHARTRACTQTCTPHTHTINYFSATINKMKSWSYNATPLQSESHITFWTLSRFVGNHKKECLWPRSLAQESCVRTRQKHADPWFP